MSIPLILIGNGFGAIMLRQFTIGNIERIKKYVYLENGAMYSVPAPSVCARGPGVRGARGSRRTRPTRACRHPLSPAWRPGA